MNKLQIVPAPKDFRKNPRVNNLGTIAYSTPPLLGDRQVSHYLLGDEKMGWNWLVGLCNKAGLYVDQDLVNSEPDDEIYEKYFNKMAEHFIIMPVFTYIDKYDNVPVYLSTSTFWWDSGQSGFIYVSKSDIRRKFGWKRISKKRYAQIVEILKGEVEEFSAYLSSVRRYLADVGFTQYQ